MSRSQGAILLARKNERQEDIAARIGVSRVAVSKWINGVSKPTTRFRELLAELYEDIPACSWDSAAPEARLAPASVRPVAPPAVPVDRHSMADELELMACEYMANLRADASMDPLAKARCMSALAVTLNQLDKRTGDIGARLFQLPIWKRIERALEVALEGHPEAAKAVGRAFRELAERSSTR